MTSYVTDLRFRLAEPAEDALLLDLFREADEGEERIRAVIRDPATTVVLATRQAEPIAGAAVRWEIEEPEIVYLAVTEPRRGQGFGRRMLDYLVEETRLRGHRSLLVGTSSSDFGNLAFYQKCGFRPDHIRLGFFDYIQPPIVENGIPMRDMVVFRRSGLGEPCV